MTNRRPSIQLVQSRLKHHVKRWEKNAEHAFKKRRKYWLTVATTSVLLNFAAVCLMLCKCFCGEWFQAMAVVGFLVFANLYSCWLVLKSVVEADKDVHKWAVEEHEKLLAQTGKANTIEEMENLVRIHLEHGNIEEADRISHQMMAMAEAQVEEKPQEPPQIIQLEKKAGLPQWMDSSSSAEQQPEKKENLPSWME